MRGRRNPLAGSGVETNDDVIRRLEGVAPAPPKRRVVGWDADEDGEDVPSSPPPPARRKMSYERPPLEESRPATSSDSRPATSSEKKPCCDSVLATINNLRGEMRSIQEFLESSLSNGEGEWLWYLPLFIDNVLRGFSQVFLCSNPFSGLGILVGLALNTTRLPAGWSLIACACSTLVARGIGAPRKDINNGDYGCDAVFLGAGLAAFVADIEPSFWWGIIPSLFLGLFAAFARKGISRFTNRAAGVPPLLLPGTLLLMLLLASMHSTGTALAPKTAVWPPRNGDGSVPSLRDAWIWFDAFCFSAGQLLFSDHWLCGAFVIGSLVWADIPKGVTAVAAAYIASIAGLGFAGAGKQNGATVTAYDEVVAYFWRGHFGYGAIAAAAVPFVFGKKDPFVLKQVLFGVVMAPLVTFASMGFRGLLRSPAESPHALAWPYLFVGGIALLSTTRHASDPAVSNSDDDREAPPASATAIAVAASPAASSAGDKAAGADDDDDEESAVSATRSKSGNFMRRPTVMQ